jgi:hypothetical protein
VPAAGAPVADAVAGAAPKTETDALREAIKDYVTLLADCDKQFFADVKPERIDKWELPVNVKAMESQCDRLLGLYEDMLARGAFRAPALDDFLRAAAVSADRYLVLGLHAKKVGVKDHIPYKKDLSELRDTLRADVAKLKESVGPVLALPDAALNASLGGDELAARAAPALNRLRGDLKDWIEVPVKASKPTWRYSLRTSQAIAERAAATLKAAGSSAGGAAVDLAKAFGAAVTFYTGAYFDTEEQEGPKVRKPVIQADTAWRNALRKAGKGR